MNLTRRDFLAASAAAAVASTTRVSFAADKRRSVLLIVADDLGSDIGCYGGWISSPNLDALARQGTLFTDAYASVSSCSSSRATLYTGLYSHTNGMYGLSHDVHNFSLLDNVKTLPWMLKQAGYATSIVGKLHVKPEALLAYDAWLLPEQPGNRDVATMSHAAGKWIREQAGKPFFITIGYSDPHRAGDGSQFGNTRDWPEVKRERYSPSDVKVPSHLPDLPEVRRDLAEYSEAVSRLDSGVGILLRELEASGRADDTLVIFLSDNGRPFPGAKDNLYCDGIGLPLIVRSPGENKRSVRSRAMASWIDITPTILDWAGAKPPIDYKFSPLPGRSILSILDQENPSGWDRVFATHSFHEINQYYPIRSVRTRQFSYFRNLEPSLDVPIASDVALSPSWKAIVAANAPLGKRTLAAFRRRPGEEMYDLAGDPGETVNLAGDSAHVATLADLRAQLAQWRTATHDPWMEGVTDPFGPAH